MDPERISAIYHFLAIDENLATGGQPTEDELRELAGAGFRSVVNLGLLGTEYALEDEEGLVRAMGVGYHHIPVDFSAPSAEDLDEFLQVMEEERGKRIFVHCAANYRVSCFVALYGQARLGWSAEEADRHIRRMWEPDERWSDFLVEARRRLGLEGS